MSQTQLDLFDPFLLHPTTSVKSKRPRRNELLEVMRLAFGLCRSQLNDYSCPKSKQTFTQPQLLACLLLKAFKKLTYRGTTELLEASLSLQQLLGLSKVPAHTTLKQFADRVLAPALLDQLVAQLLLSLQEKGLVTDEVALDSTGLNTSSASAYFLSRAKRANQGYVKVSIAIACKSIVLVGMDLSVGPSNDLTQAHGLMWKAMTRCRADWYLMDKGFDAEWVHELAAAGGAMSYIPPIVRSADGTIKSGPHRVRCGAHEPYHYGRRWHVESFFSGLKRTCGSSLAARSQKALVVEAGLKVLAYAIRR